MYSLQLRRRSDLPKGRESASAILCTIEGGTKNLGSISTAISKAIRLKVDRVIAQVRFKLEREIIAHEPTQTSLNLG